MEVEGCTVPNGLKVEPTSVVALSELGTEPGRAGTPGHPVDGLGGRGVHGPQWATYALAAPRC